MQDVQSPRRRNAVRSFMLHQDSPPLGQGPTADRRWEGTAVSDGSAAGPPHIPKLLEVRMVFLLKLLKCLWVGSQEVYCTGREVLAFQARSLSDRVAAGTAHVARDHVPLHHRLQIRLSNDSHVHGSCNSKVQFIWRYKWDSSLQSSPNHSGC